MWKILEIIIEFTNAKVSKFMVILDLPKVSKINKKLAQSQWPKGLIQTCPESGKGSKIFC